MHSVTHKWHGLTPAVAHCVVNKVEAGGVVSVNKDRVNQSPRVELGLLINAGTASSKSWVRERLRHRHSKATEPPHANLPCPPRLCLSLSVSLLSLHSSCTASGFFLCCTLILLCIWRRLRTSALSCSADTRLGTPSVLFHMFADGFFSIISKSMWREGVNYLSVSLRLLFNVVFLFRRVQQYISSRPTNIHHFTLHLIRAFKDT